MFVLILEVISKKVKRIIALLLALALCATFSNAVRVSAETEVSALAACSHSSSRVVKTETSAEEYSHAHKVVTSVNSTGQPVYSMCDVYVSYTVISKRCNDCNALFYETKTNERHTLAWAHNNPYNP